VCIGTNRSATSCPSPKSSAWEWLINEAFGPHIVEAGITWIEPAWKLLLSNKAILAVMWEIAPNHPNLLPAYLDGPRDLTRYVKKPRLSREGANVEIVDGAFSASEGGDYGYEGFVWQALAELPADHAVVGSWMVDQSPAGIGIREPQEGTRITTNTARFVPHRIS
jgi:glutathionylspermidine synthase